jgi:hypothetical protein
VSETITDIFGETCTVLDRCGQCRAPRYQRAGETGWTCLHEQGCRGLNLGAWHVDARCEMEQAKANDARQIEHRVKEYGGNVGTPNGYQGPKRAPSKTGVTQ